MQFHWGEPKKLMTLSGTSGWTQFGKDNPWIAHRFIRPINWWIGVSWRGKWFIGFMRTGEQDYERVPNTPASEQTAV